MSWQQRRRWAAVGVALGALASGAACGTGDAATEAGFEPAGGAGGDGGAAGAGAGGQPDLAGAWPSADPDPGQAPTGAPTFEPPTEPPPTSCGDKPGAKGDRTLTVPFKGLLRTALVHVPAGYDPAKGAMVVLNFHGFSSDGLQEALLSRMNQASDAHGFIAVHPYGVVNSWNAGKCCGTAWLDAVDDVGFTGALLDQLEAEYCVDKRRVYATGMSNGGFLSHRLGCDMADRIAAIAPVAGVMSVASCKPSRPVPVLHFHGTDDGLVPYNGGNPLLNVGLQGELDFPSVAASTQGWRDRDGCAGDGEKIYDKGDAVCVRWGCQAGTEVILCSIKGGGHTWPGGVPIPPFGKTSVDINATEAMINFFEAHPMP